MTLRTHIDKEYKGNVAAFARDVGTSHTQASRWLGMGCIWLNGQTWKQQSNLNND